MRSFVPVKQPPADDSDSEQGGERAEASRGSKKIGKVTRSKKSATNFLVATYNMVEVG